MDALKLLRRQAKALWKMEMMLSPEERKNHSWQLAATQGGIPYLVGKGDANTFFYRRGTEELQYGLPDDVFAVVDQWIDSEFLLYAIMRKRDWEQARHVSADINKLLKRLDAKYDNHYIVGRKADGTLERLMQFRAGLMGNQWVPIKKG